MRLCDYLNCQFLCAFQKFPHCTISQLMIDLEIIEIKYITRISSATLLLLRHYTSGEKLNAFRKYCQTNILLHTCRRLQARIPNISCPQPCNLR